VAILAFMVAADVAQADGLLCKLAKDGTWATYQLDGSGKNVGEFGFNLAAKGTLRIASVGRVTEDQQPCRWIEIQFDAEYAIGNEKVKKSDWWKILIPEKYLVRGQSPLDHVLRAWYRSEADDSSQKTDDPSDGRTPLPIILSGPLADGERLKAAEIDSGLGTLACEGMQGTLNLTTARGGALPPIREKWKIETRVHPKCPFGVVACSWTLNSSLETQVWHLNLRDFGENATSKMPDAK
jgi:hypothetical protein